MILGILLTIIIFERKKYLHNITHLFGVTISERAPTDYTCKIFDTIGTHNKLFTALKYIKLAAFFITLQKRLIW